MDYLGDRMLGVFSGMYWVFTLMAAQAGALLIAALFCFVALALMLVRRPVAGGLDGR